MLHFQFTCSFLLWALFNQKTLHFIALHQGITFHDSLHESLRAGSSSVGCWMFTQSSQVSEFGWTQYFKLLLEMEQIKAFIYHFWWVVVTWDQHYKLDLVTVSSPPPHPPLQTTESGMGGVGRGEVGEVPPLLAHIIPTQLVRARASQPLSAELCKHCRIIADQDKYPFHFTTYIQLQTATAIVELCEYPKFF